MALLLLPPPGGGPTAAEDGHAVMALRKEAAGDVARGARPNNHAALAKKKDDDAAPPPPLPRSPEQSSSRKGLQGTPPRRRPGDAATPSPARRSAPSSATSSSAASRSEPPQQGDTGGRARMLSHLGPPQPIDLSLNAARLPRWRSLRSRGAKLYAWSCAARLSAEGRGAGVGGGFGAAPNVAAAAASEGDLEGSRPSETSLELLRLQQVARIRDLQRDHEKKARERELALEATTRMLDYLGRDEARLGSRLSLDALAEIGADDGRRDPGDAFGDATVAGRHHRRGSSAGSSHSDGDGSHGPESDGEARRWWKRRDHKSSSVSSSARDFESSEDGDSDREPLGWSKDAGGAIANHLATFRFQRALDAAVAGAESDHGTTGSAETSSLAALLGEPGPARPSSTKLSAASARAAAAFASRAEEGHARNHAVADGPPQPPPLAATASKPAHLGAIAPAPAIELYPKTRSVLKLHAAIALGDARAVRAAAEDGAAGGHVGAFATMARALHVAAARDGAFGAPRAGMVELLVSLGADACAPDAIGATPLHVAAACGNASALAALIRCASASLEAAADDGRDEEQEADDAAKRAARLRCHAGLTPLEVALTRRRDARELFASMLCRARSFDVDFGSGPLGIKLALVRHVVSGPASASGAAPFGRDPRSRPGFPPPPPPPPPPPLLSRRSRHSPEAASKGLAAAAFRGHRRANSDGSSAPPLDPRAAAKQSRRQRALEAERAASKSHRRVRSHDNAADAETADDFCGPRAPPARTLLVSSVSPDCDARGLLEPGDQLLCLNGLVLAAPDEENFPALMARVKELRRPLHATFVAGSFPHLSVEDDPCVDLLLRFSPDPSDEHTDDLPR